MLAYLQVLVFLQGSALSGQAAHVMLESAGTRRLPTPLHAMLDVPPDFLEQHRSHAAAWAGSQASAQGTGPLGTVGAWAGLTRLANVWALPRDTSDYQWREFRGSLPQLAAAMLGFVALSHLVRPCLVIQQEDLSAWPRRSGC